MACSEQWKYRGEGNSSLVLSCPMRNVVIRLKKFDSALGKSLFTEDQKSIRKELENQIGFVGNIMAPLIGWDYLVPMSLVELSSEHFVDGVSNLVPRRPGQRVAWQCDDGPLLAVEMPDLCHISLPVDRNRLESSAGREFTSDVTYSLEIKPKWGFIEAEDCELNEDSSEDPRRYVCRFCMHQFLKIKERKWTRHSHYCPIDLFSGCPVRMKKALQELLQSPQNNLRLFKGGEVIWSEEVNTDLDSELALICSSTDKLLDVVIKCLLHSSAAAAPPAAVNSSPLRAQKCFLGCSNDEHRCSAACPQLPTGSILSRLLTVQRLSNQSLSEILTIHNSLQECFSRIPGLRERSEIDGPFAVDNWLGACSTSVCNPTEETAILQIKRFLVARSAKDCSIFVSIRRLNDGFVDDDLPSRCFVVFDSDEGQRFVCRSSLVDLDMKPFNKIPFYFKEDNDVVSHYSTVHSAAETLY